PVQILWVNMTTAVCLGLMLAFEPKERDLMDRPPRDPNAPLLTQTLVVRILLVSVVLSAGVDALYEWTLARGDSEAEARTAAVAGLVFGEAFYLLNCRSLERSVFSVGLFTNPLLWAGIAVMTALQLGFTYLPAANALFGTAPIDGIEWLAVIAPGVAVFAVVGLEKGARRALAARRA
ncbi:MAG: cation transporting ATPase C-terminal domain-containing protein, partial [Candidatus Methylomirabilis sp.]|nr:cation transporting ATPase C-terminal domain-containing protein [Deltaproteobacteria bacterium]